MGDARKFFHHSEPFAMRRGGVLPGFTLAWESWGTLSPARDNVVLIFTGLSPDAHAASSEADPAPGWWEFMVGPDKPIDTNRWYVICVNSLGSCKGSTGPASINPDTGELYKTGFPELAIEDIAASADLLIQSLGIDQIAVLVGPSMGGMTALAYSLLLPEKSRHFVSLSSAVAASPFAIAIRSLQREFVMADREYRDGDYHDWDGPGTGMRLARKLGMISYRSAEEWRGRFGRDRIPQERISDQPFAMEFEVQSYLDAAAERFIGGFDPNCYLYLSRSMDWFDGAEHGFQPGGHIPKFESARILGVCSDILFPCYQQQEIADILETAGIPVSFEELGSIQGHDAFLVDKDGFGPNIREYLDAL